MQKRIAKRSRMLLVALGALSAFGPLSMDLYLPVLPSLAQDLETTDALAQLTMSACLIGLALGQLIYGPVSDRIGRRVPLLIGVAGFMVMSLVCAVAPTIELLIVARFLQGLGGAAGIVVSRAIVRDIYGGRDAARVFSILMAITGIAPVLAPLAGGALSFVMDWRGIFVVLAGIGLAILILAWLVVPDSLQEEHRHRGGLAAQSREMGSLLGHRSFMAYVVAIGLAGAGLFTYISMSSLVFQEQYGLSPQAFSLVFAINSVGIVIGTQVNRSLVRRFTLSAIALAALGLAVIAALSLTVAAWLGLAIIALLVPLFVATMAQGAIGPDITAIALEPYARGAGAAAAILGTVQFLIGAIIPPLASIGGTSAIVMGVTMTACLLAALVVLGLQVRSASNKARGESAHPEVAAGDIGPA